MNGKSIVLWVVAIGCIAVGVVNLNRRSNYFVREWV